MTKEPAGLETMKTKLRLPSPTSLTDKSSRLSASLEERAGTDFMYSMRDVSSSGRNSEKDMVAGDSGAMVLYCSRPKIKIHTKCTPNKFETQMHLLLFSLPQTQSL